MKLRTTEELLSCPRWGIREYDVIKMAERHVGILDSPPPSTIFPPSRQNESSDQEQLHRVYSNYSSVRGGAF